MISNNFFKNNRNKYFDKVSNNSLSIFYSGITYNKSADECFDFEVDKNFYYLTGINQENVALIMIKENNNCYECLYLEENDPIKVKWIGPKITKEEATLIGEFNNIEYYDNDNLKKYISKCINKGIKDIYYNKDKYFGFYNFNKDYINKLIGNEDVNLLDGYSIVVGLRTFKEEYEINQIKESIEITKNGIEELMSNCEAGMLEYELESYFDFYIKSNGNRQLSFKTIAASGRNATVLHYTSNDNELNDGDLILFDLGCKTNLYASDISRTFPVNGKFTDRQKEVYEEVLNVNKKCIEYLKPGITRKEFNEYANDLIADACIRLGLINKKEDVNKYYWHSIGHSLGLDTHDPCDYNMPLDEGYIITVEPGIYIE